VRKELGEALRDYGTANRDVVVVEADVASSTGTSLFRDAHPDRFINVGIAEAGMVDTAVGLALGGKLPFVSAFAAVLCNRALEQIRTCVAYNNVGVKLLAGFAGVSDYKDGATHHSIFDLAVMRAMPNMTVVVASDGEELRSLVPAVAEYPGPIYLRVSRADVPCLFPAGAPIRIGRARVVREGKDLSLIVNGTPLHRAVAAASLLDREGISARVVEMHTLKPLDDGAVLQCAEETGAIVTVEEHSVIGGLYGAVAEVLSRRMQGGRIPVAPVGLRDEFSRTAPSPEAIWDYCGLRPADIAEAARQAVRGKDKR